MTAVLLFSNAACAVGWLCQYISARVLAWYLLEKKCPPPTRAELRQGTRFVVEEIFKCFSGNKR